MTPAWIGRLLLICSMGMAATALAKLPDPTPEEVAKKQADVEKNAKNEEIAKEALAKAQDRVNQRYRATHKNAPPPVAVVTTPAPAAGK